MILNPIVPVPVMIVICVILLLLKRKGTATYIIQILITLLLFAINLRPMVRGEDLPTPKTGIDVLFVVDNTISMQAEDYGDDEPRMNGVKKDVAYIMDKLPGAEYSILVFGNEPRRMLPFTGDKNLVLQVLETLSGETSTYAKGTCFDAVPGSMKDALDEKTDDKKIVVFISDGEITQGDKLPSFSAPGKLIDGGLVLGYGTKKGAPMKAAEYIDYGETKYVTYYDEEYMERQAISCIDETNLKAIGRDLGVDYLHMSAETDMTDIDSFTNAVMMNAELQYDDESTAYYRDLYFWFLIPLFILLLAEFYFTKRKLK